MRHGGRTKSSAWTSYSENVAPKLKPAGFELDKRQVELFEKFGIGRGRYEVLSRDVKADVELYRDENVPIQTEIDKLEQTYDRSAAR